MMKKALPFRAWFYFRIGWATYFAFIFSAINTMVVTYYLAIEKIPNLLAIFPTFTHYVLILSFTGIPFLVFAGYVHYKRSSAISEEFEISTESNPYWFKIQPGWNKEVIFPLYMQLTRYLIKSSQNEKLSEDEIKEIKEIQEKIQTLLDGNYVGNYWKLKKK